MSNEQPRQEQTQDAAAETAPGEDSNALTEDGVPAAEKMQDAPAARRSAVPRRRPGARGLLLIVLLLAACAALGLAAYNYQQLQQQQGLTERMQILEQGLALQGQARAELKDALEARVLEERVLWQQAEQRQQEALARTSARITQLDGNRREDWLLAEVEYLLRLASQRLLIENDVKSARVLLESADQVVRSIDDYSLLKVREALQLDLVALRAVPDQDINGSYLQLAALAAQIDQLPSMPVDPFTAAESVADADDAGVAEPLPAEGADAWMATANRLVLEAWQGFAGLYRINSHRDEPVQVLLTPNEEIYLRQNLRLMLEQAQLALLQGRQSVYDQSLAKAQLWLQRYFQRQNATTSMLEQLAQLAKVQVRPQLPEIGRGLKALKQHLEALYQQSLEPQSPQPAEDRSA